MNCIAWDTNKNREAKVSLLPKKLKQAAKVDFDMFEYRK